ncbi:MAG: carbon starvation protein A [Firmicutes bacterium]|nr:carbon starvation protein A [Bacillota bacterium]
MSKGQASSGSLHDAQAAAGGTTATGRPAAGRNPAPSSPGRKALAAVAWAIVAILAAFAFATLAIHRGERVNALWLLVAALGTYALGYRFYALWIARRVMELDPERATPAVVHNDGRDFVPTNRWVLYGHHFAAIAGAGPLVGPTLAAQMGWLPGTLWIVVGAVLAGAVQDFVVLFASMRRKGRSLGEMASDEVGPVGGWIAQIGTLLMALIVLAVLALVVVNALKGSPWGTFVVAMTIPIAILMGLYMRFVRPGQVGEATLLGVALMLVALILGRGVAASPVLAPLFTLTAPQLAVAIMIYGFLASILPVWFLLVPRDYLSTFLKLGTIALLAVGIVVVHPQLQMTGVTRFIDGTGPVFAGKLFPFLFITIACGALSGWHTVISSGTSPKLLERETDAPMIGYAGMLAESFVAVMAMAAATLLTPGLYFAINSPASAIGTTVAQAAHTISSWGFTIDAATLQRTAQLVGEKSILSRTGGAPSLAVGMAHVFSRFLGGEAVMAFWYHFAILFEAVFILTTVDAGTRVARFMFQGLVGRVWPKFGDVSWYPATVLASALTVAIWGYFLYAGATDPLGGINTLWPLFGIANQMLGAVALVIATTVFIKMGKAKYSFVTLVPMLFMYATTWTAALEKIFSPDPKIGFWSHANAFAAKVAAGQIPAPAKTLAQAHQVIFNDRVDAVLTGVFLLIMAGILVDAVRAWLPVLFGRRKPELHEEPYRRRVAFQPAAGGR